MHCTGKFVNVIKEPVCDLREISEKRDILEYREMKMLFQFCKKFSYEGYLQ